MREKSSAFRAAGSGDGEFTLPCGLAANLDDNQLVVCDLGNDRLQIFDAADGRFVRMIGRSGIAPGELSKPYSCACIEGFATRGADPVWQPRGAKARILHFLWRIGLAIDWACGVRAEPMPL